MKKIIKILLSLILILAFLNITLSRYSDEMSDISRRLGNKITGGTISARDYARISELYKKYIEALKIKDYETAYNFLSYEYKQYKDYESFLSEVSSCDFENILIKDIVVKTENMYNIIIETMGEEKENLIIFPPDVNNCYIVPEPFLQYKKLNEKIKKRKVEYEVIDTINYLDKFIVNLKITNLDKNNIVSISEIELREDNVVGKKADIDTLKIAPFETQTISIQFSTDIDFPTEIAVSRVIYEKDMVETYVISI